MSNAVQSHRQPGIRASWSVKNHLFDCATSGPSAFAFNCGTRRGTWPCSIQRSTVSCVRPIWSGCAFVMLRTAIGSRSARSCCSKRHNAPCSSRLQSRHARRSGIGLLARAYRRTLTVSVSAARFAPSVQAPIRQLLLEHSKLESTVRYLGIEVDDALEMAEQTEG